MEYEAQKRRPHIRFLSEQPNLGRPADVFTRTHHESFSFDDPPPWEPLFEEFSCSSASPPLHLDRRPLDPPPPCFSTRTPLRIKSNDFPPFCIPTVSDKLIHGFRMLYPRGVFERHGINRADWIRFLEDLGIAARLAAAGLSAVRSRVPTTTLLTRRFFPVRIFGAVYDGHFVRSPVEEIRALIQIWNQCAFERRKIRVSLQVRQIRTSRKMMCVLVVESLGPGIYPPPQVVSL